MATMGVTNNSVRPKVVCRCIAPNEEAAYLEFAGAQWGKNSPQANRSFLAWLYKENPNTLGINRDLWVLVDGNKIVGTHHRMRIPWRVNGKRLVVPSLHFLAVIASHRVGREQSNKIYERMRIPAVRVFWLEKIQNRAKVGAQMVAARLGWSMRSGRPIHRRITKAFGFEVARIADPAPDEIIEALTITPQAQTYPDWDLTSYHWRFFHELGPQNILLLARRNGRLAGRAIVSLGVRNGVIVARVVELVFDGADCLDALLEEIEQTLSYMRVPVCLTVTSSQEVAERFRRAGWEYRRGAIGARWFTQKGEVPPRDFSISGGAWDYGCDARIED